MPLPRFKSTNFSSKWLKITTTSHNKPALCHHKLSHTDVRTASHHTHTQYHICLPYLGQTKSTCRSIPTEHNLCSIPLPRSSRISEFFHFQPFPEHQKRVPRVSHTHTLFVEQSIAHTAIFRSPCNIFGSHK